MSNKLLSIIFLFSSSLLFIGCDPDDPEIIVEPEIITTLNYTLMPVGGGSAVILSFQDLDGDGGNDPIIINGTLNSNESYIANLELLNESVSPAESITEEIVAEDDEHQFFFMTTVSNLSIAYADQDDNGNPIGLETNLTTGDPSSGNITITLRHQPDKSASGVINGDISNAGGETDIEVTFALSIE